MNINNLRVEVKTGAAKTRNGPDYIRGRVDPLGFKVGCLIVTSLKVLEFRISAVAYFSNRVHGDALV